MANLGGCGSMHQQLLQQPRWRTPQRTAGLCSDGMWPLRWSFSSRCQPMQAASGQLGRRRLEVVGEEGTSRVPRRTMALLASRESRENCGCEAISGGGIDSAAEVSGRRGEGGECAPLGHEPVNESVWRFELENLIHGRVGWFASLAVVLLGMGVGCLTSVGDAQAATSHIANGSGGLDVDMRALALGPEGPLLEEFWDNMRRYGLYFLTVVSGGAYQLVKPALDGLKNPVTAVLIIVVVTGSIYLVSLTVSAMLGINEFQYDYAV